MRAKLKSGNYEIEAEGRKAEVDKLLEDWWKRLNVANPAREAPAPKRSPKAKGRTSHSGNGGDGTNFDPIPLTNTIKEDARHSTYEAHVLHKKDMYNKIALVCLVAGKPLTSGEIAKTLQALDLKADQGNVSRAIKANSGKFLSTSVRKKGAAPPRYKLTSKARKEFDAWLAQQK